MMNQRDNAFDRDGIGCHPFDANSDRSHDVCFLFRVAAGGQPWLKRIRTSVAIDTGESLEVLCPMRARPSRGAVLLNLKQIRQR